jgi:2'-5' RNA ligase
MKRLFFALWPDATVRAHLARLAQSHLPRRAEATPAADFHLTLAFLGNLDAEQQAGVETLASSIRAAPLEFAIDQVGYWAKPQILWAGCATPPPALLDLVKNLQAGLPRYGIEVERRPWVAHVTLARRSPSGPLRPMPVESCVWQARELVLAESAPGAGDSRYQVRRRWGLACEHG